MQFCKIRSWAHRFPFRHRRFVSFCVGLLVACGLQSPWINSSVYGQSPPTITEQLLATPTDSLVETIMTQGDAQRGALLFYQQQLQCATCHQYESDAPEKLGPNLTKFDKVDRWYLVESILAPSRVLREGYETHSITTPQGQVVIGLMSPSPDGPIFRDATGKIIDSYESVNKVNLSLMPAGLPNLLANVEQFYDLARYVIEIAEQGESRARQLQPPVSMTQLPPLPEYEQRIDHAGLLRSWDEQSLERGARIYNRVCANCHGTVEREGSLPTAPKFTASQLKNGSDPYRLYQTLTHGYGMMIAQRWMVPQQKYDVIHYLRTEFFEPHNQALLTKIDDNYLQSLPPGDTFGPEPAELEPYIAMNYGNSMMHTFEIELNNSGEDGVGWDLGNIPRAKNPWADPDEYFEPGEAPNYAYKGIALRLDQGPGGVTRGNQWLVYDHDTMNVQAAWFGPQFIDYSCIQFDGKHACHNRLRGEIMFENPVGPGWAQPLTGVFADPRPVGRDGRPYGPLPKPWSQYKGLYQHGDLSILAYTVGGVSILDTATAHQPTADDQPGVIVRHLRVGSAAHSLKLRVAPEEISVRTDSEEATAELLHLVEEDGFHVLQIDPHTDPIDLRILIAPEDESLDIEPQQLELARLTQGGTARWPERIRTNIETVHDEIFAVDQMTLPKSNPWNCQVRPTGQDFFADERRAAVCTWDGDVWIVSGIDQTEGELTWQRIASGLFQPLGLKIVDEQIFVTCRDQLVVLRDLNGDGETDFYECFNNDHQVTEHFHEFAMGLQVDDEGNFYYAKSGRHAKRAVVPHHGTLLRITPDGKRTEIVATGFRAANGVCLNPDGSFFVTDQEGHWNPKNRINWVTEGKFYGNLYSFTDVTDPSDEAMEQPLCWITNRFDRSPAELLWVPEGTWGPLAGSLLNLSYGYGQIYIVPHERIGNQMQGGMSPLPIPRFPSGLVRGRFHQSREELFLCSMFSWAGSQQDPGGFHRVRYQGRPVHAPIDLAAAEKKLTIRFSHPVDVKSARNVESFTVKAWDLKRTANYGSQHHNERELTVTAAQVSSDGYQVELSIPRLAPTWGMSIEYRLRGSGGRNFTGEIHNSIYKLPLDSQFRADGHR